TPIRSTAAIARPMAPRSTPCPRLTDTLLGDEIGGRGRQPGREAGPDGNRALRARAGTQAAGARARLELAAVRLAPGARVGRRSDRPAPAPPLVPAPPTPGADRQPPVLAVRAGARGPARLPGPGRDGRPRPRLRALSVRLRARPAGLPAPDHALIRAARPAPDRGLGLDQYIL